MKETFQKDVAEFRRTLLIQPKGPLEVTFTFRTGLQCTIGADASYGKVWFTGSDVRVRVLLPNPAVLSYRHLAQYTY